MCSKPLVTLLVHFNLSIAKWRMEKLSFKCLLLLESGTICFTEVTILYSLSGLTAETRNKTFTELNLMNSVNIRVSHIILKMK